MKVEIGSTNFTIELIMIGIFMLFAPIIVLMCWLFVKIHLMFFVTLGYWACILIIMEMGVAIIMYEIANEKN